MTSDRWKQQADGRFTIPLEYIQYTGKQTDWKIPIPWKEALDENKLKEVDRSWKRRMWLRDIEKAKKEMIIYKQTYLNVHIQRHAMSCNSCLFFSLGITSQTCGVEKDTSCYFLTLLTDRQRVHISQGHYCNTDKEFDMWANMSCTQRTRT